MFAITDSGFGSALAFAGTLGNANGYGQNVLTPQQMDHNLDATAMRWGPRKYADSLREIPSREVKEER